MILKFYDLRASTYWWLLEFYISKELNNIVIRTWQWFFNWLIRCLTPSSLLWVGYLLYVVDKSMPSFPGSCMNKRDGCSAVYSSTVWETIVCGAIVCRRSSCQLRHRESNPGEEEEEKDGCWRRDRFSSRNFGLSSPCASRSGRGLPVDLWDSGENPTGIFRERISVEHLKSKQWSTEDVRWKIKKYSLLRYHNIVGIITYLFIYSYGQAQLHFAD